MSTKAQRAFALVDDAAREACEDGEWLHGVDWYDYESIVASHVTRRVRGGWAIGLSVAIHWGGAEPVTRERITKFLGEWAADDIKLSVSDSIGVMIQADRMVGDVGDFAEAVERIYRQRFKDVLLGRA